MPVPAPCARSGKTAERMPLLPMFRQKSCRSCREAFAAGQYTDFSAAGRCELALLRSAPGRDALRAGARHLRGVGAPLGSRRPGQHHLRRPSGRPHHRPLSPGADAPPRHGRRAGLRRRQLPFSSALSPPAGRAEGRTSFFKGLLLPASHSLARLRESGEACARMAEAQLAAADFGALCRVSPEAMGSALRQKNIFLT